MCMSFLIKILSLHVYNTNKYTNMISLVYILYHPVFTIVHTVCFGTKICFKFIYI